MTKVAEWAARYCSRGFAVTWTPLGQKGPRHLGWNLTQNAITDRSAALEHWSRNPSHGVAALLAPSGLVSIDVDDEGKAETVLQHLGLNLDSLREKTPCIVGRHYQLVFRAPDAALKHRSIAWPKEGNPRASFVLFEFRAGNITSTLPPTIHPGTGQPYRWENPPRHGFPPLPPQLLELWLDWPETNRRALALCPWAPKATSTSDIARRVPRSRERTGPSVIAEFNEAHDVSVILESHGYVRRGKRFTSAESSHAAGVVLLDGGRVFCHHQGDPLSGEHAHDAFDCFRILAHGGDYRAAVRAAAHALGLDRERAA